MCFCYTSTQDRIVHKMISDLSGLKYGYRSIVEGAFEATQYSSLMSVPKECRNRMKKECVDKVLEVFAQG